MSYSNSAPIPSWWKRLYSVWYRHFRVYTSNFYSNAFPPFFEPLIFLVGLGLGLGSFIPEINGMGYLLFLAGGIMVTSAMYTAAFECTYGTYIRLVIDRIYDGMLGSPLLVRDIIWGEILFVGTKGFFFSLAVLIVVSCFGIVKEPLSILVPGVGFLTGVIFAALSLVITSLVHNINHFNFYLTGCLSPMFFFAGVVFPLANLPLGLQYFAEILPLTHVVRLARALISPELLNFNLVYDFLYCLVFLVVMSWLAIKGLEKRMID